ncbi:hypothetical protein [Lysobacter sp. Root690]|uniref:hypothetical protein n=1 Tax=Lysobacter sp. Root690 TaxID=1736588 RepID=UPI0006FC9D16|nr:hypothetical protein [Lysobacter sp. Root690]KRB11290.1 hypothetical protein ASD86_02360 [Lysobacter sp. Root690]
MINAGRWALILMFWFIGVACALAGKVSLPGVVTLLSGVTLPVIASNWAFSRSRARQGKPDDYTESLADWTHLSGPDIAVLALAVLAGVGLFVSAFVVFGVGG